MPKIDYENSLMHIFPILLNDKYDRDIFREKLLEKDIQTGIHYFPNHLLSFYNSESNNYLKNTEQIYPKLITLPLHPDLCESDIKFIVSSLNELF